MLESIKVAGKNISRELSRAWEGYPEGWRELLSRSGEALTHFAQRRDENALIDKHALTIFPRRGL